MPKKTFTSEEKAAYYEQQQADIKNMFEKIDKGVQEVFQSEKFRDYLKFCSMFTDYSANNTMLIAMQKPDASLIASFKKWQEIGRNVNRGSKGIEIFAPVQVKTNHVIQEERPVKDEFGNQEYNDDGTIKTETIEKPLKQLSFKKVYVFDVSQTSGKELPNLVDDLSGDIDKDKMDAILNGIRKAVSVPVEFEDIASGAKGYYSYSENKIAINKGMSDVQTIKTAFHEAAHCLLHNPQRNINSNKTTRNDKEVQAESTAFIIANKYGIDTSEYSFPYIASWAEKKELSTLKNMLGDIQNAAREISNSIDNELLKLKKRDLSIDELITDTELNNMQKAEILIDRKKSEGVIFTKDVSDEVIDFAVKSDNMVKVVKKVDEASEIQKQRDSYGYDFTYMNLIDSKENALAEFDKGETIYLLYPDNTEGMALERSEIESFTGMFGTEKEQQTEKTITEERNPELIQVSKENALSLYDKGVEVYIDGDFAEDRTEIQAAQEHSIISVNQYQYSAELNFDKPNAEKTDVVRNNSNIIGNTPYKELGEKSELAYFKANKELANTISEQLENAGIKYSGLKKTDSTTFTVNKKDIEQYKNIVSKITAVSDPVPEKPTAEKQRSKIVGNTSFNELVDVKKHTYKARVAENIIKELSAEGIKFSAANQGATTVISVSGENENDFNSVVNKVKQNFISQQKQKEVQPEIEIPSVETVNGDLSIDKNKKPFSFDVFTVQSFTDIKENNAVDQWRKEMDNAKACVKFINENLSQSYENRSLDEFMAKLEDKFGLDNSMHILSATIQIKKHDGRFTNEVKERASKYEFANDSRRGEFLTEQHPVMLNHLFQKMVEREQELSKIQSKPKLNSYFNDKHVFPVERIELRTDKRGFPQTVSKKSEINERFVEGYGWLNNDQYTKAMKSSNNPSDFSQKVSKICVSYVNDNGRFGLADIDRAEYDVFTQKTYSLENKESYEAAKQKNEAFKSRHQGQQTEYYAVRQLSAEKYAIITLGSDGTPDFVKRDISKQDAIKAITDIYTEKTKNKIRCEIIQPDKIDKLSIEAYKNQNEIERNPDVFYKVLPNPNKQVADRLSHFVQEYKKDGDGYKASAVTMVGTYDECHALTEKLMKSEIEPTYKIYQLTDNHRDLTFENTEYLKQHGIQPTFSNYKKVYEAALSDLSGNVSDCLEEIYTKFNMYHPVDFKGHSLSVSDVVVVDKDPYFVDSIGFKKLNGFTPEQTIEAMQEKFMNNFDDRLKNINSSEELKAFADEAKSLGIDCDVELNKSIAAAADIKAEKEIPMIKTQKRGI